MDDATEVRELGGGEVAAAVALLARGMRDNPLHVAAYGTDPERRQRCHARLVGALFAASPRLALLGAFRGGTLAGVTGIAPAGSCRPSTGQRLRIVPRLLSLGPRAAARVGRWVGTWAEHDPDEPHVHLGPLAVDAHLQGGGIGSTIVREHCRRLDATGEVGYLETDKDVNVGFYQRFGYQVVGETDVLGVPNWFMRRQSPGRSSP